MADNNNNIKYFEFLLILALVYYVTYQEPERKIKLIIGIFSAPQNFHQRDALRKTWLKLAEDETSRYYFILGKTMCPLHPHDRQDIFGCAERNLFRYSEELTTPNSFSHTSSQDTAEGFGFIADYSIQVTHIGLADCYHPSNEAVTVELKDGLNGRTLRKVSMSTKNSELVAITPVTFPRYSEGLIVINRGNISSGLMGCPTIDEDSEDAIRISRFLKNGRLVAADDKTGVYASIKYKIMENNTAEEWEERKRLWTSIIETTQQEVEKESEKFHDILIVNVTDVYKNLPKKLMEFLTYANGDSIKIDYDYLMKTDDDSFVDVRRVLSQLPNSPEEGMWWWSSFKEFWHVPHQGKWREDNYESATYPPFPCGGGYVINKETSKYLSDNHKNLKFFQGEDVSLGIWLSPFNVKNHISTGESKNYKSLMLRICQDGCEWTCSNEASSRPRCNLVQLSIPQMFTKWDNFKETGHL